MNKKRRPLERTLFSKICDETMLKHCEGEREESRSQSQRRGGGKALRDATHRRRSDPLKKEEQGKSEQKGPRVQSEGGSTHRPDPDSGVHTRVGKSAQVDRSVGCRWKEVRLSQQRPNESQVLRLKTHLAQQSRRREQSRVRP